MSISAVTVMIGKPLFQGIDWNYVRTPQALSLVERSSQMPREAVIRTAAPILPILQL
jgi:hypothetical protein